MNSNISLKRLRKEQYEYNICLLPYLNDWKKYPYTYLKIRLYMEASAVLVYFLAKTKIKPNTVTITYGLLGLIGGILLSIPAHAAIYTAICIFFLKGILDSTDGHLARLKKQTSVTGDVLDPYGALLGALGFKIGLGFYVAHKSGIMLFYYLIPLIPLFYALKAHHFADVRLFLDYITSERIKKYKSMASEALSGKDAKNPGKVLNDGFSVLRNMFTNFLDDCARTVDFVCLLIFLEQITHIFVTWIIFLGFLLKQFLIFTASFYLVARKDWAEKQLAEKLKEIEKA